MRSTATRDLRFWGKCTTTGLLLASLNFATFAQTLVPPALEAAASDGEGRRDVPASLAGVHMLLGGSSGEDFTQAFEAILETRPRLGMDALVLRAGMPVPAGVSAARAERRESLRDESVTLLRSRLEGRDGKAWRARLSELLAVESTLDEDLRCAAIGAVAELELFGLARRVGAHLVDPNPRIRNAASNALFDLYRVRFTDAPEFAAAWPALGAIDGEPPLRSALRAEQAQSREWIAALLEQLDEEDAERWLSHAEPRIRADAGLAVTRAVGAGRLDAATAMGLLRARLEAEHDPDAFHAVSQSLLSLVGSAPPDADAVVELRASLDRVAERGQRDLTGLLMKAWSSMPWDEELAEGDSSLAAGLERVVALFGRAVDRERPLDPDHALMGVEALGRLYGRAGGEVEALASVAEAARDELDYLLTDYNGPEPVRAAAAGAFSRLVGRDVPRILELLAEDDPRLPALPYELLGSLGRALPEATIEEARGRQILSTLLRLIDHQDVELRRRAIDVLSSDTVGELLTTWGSSGMAVKLAERLDAEDQPELRSTVLSLLGRFSQPELVDRILHSPVFDELTAGGSREISELAEALRRLSGGSPVWVGRSATRLLIDQRGERRDDARLVRLESALSMMASLAPEAASQLEPEVCRRVVDWALEWRELSEARLSGTDERDRVLKQLVEVYLEAAASPEGDTPRLAGARALFLGDYWLSHREEMNVEDVRTRYSSALGLLDPGSPEHFQLLRARARFQFDADLLRDAVRDYNALRAETSAEGTPAGELDLSDLRRVAALTAEPPVDIPERDRRAANGGGFDVSLELVEHENWQQEPAQVRLQDLRDLAERARLSHDPARIGRLQKLFVDFPEAPPESATAAGEADADTTELPVWNGLVRRPEWHGVLKQLRAELVLAEPKAEPAAEGASETDTTPDAGDDAGPPGKR